MATVPTQVRIDEELKKQATELFGQLGLDMSGAINIFLRQAVLRGGLPFKVEIPQYNQTVQEAMKEAKKISRDTSVQSYKNLDDMFQALDNE
ncbi:MAG: type II toxin-antitoxin system RelB/DinJ family antitoxin [Eubacterium sp.]